MFIVAFNLKCINFPYNCVVASCFWPSTYLSINQLKCVANNAQLNRESHGIHVILNDKCPLPQPTEISLLDRFLDFLLPGSQITGGPRVSHRPNSYTQYNSKCLRRSVTVIVSIILFDSHSFLCKTNPYFVAKRSYLYKRKC